MNYKGGETDRSQSGMNSLHHSMGQPSTATTVRSARPIRTHEQLTSSSSAATPITRVGPSSQAACLTLVPSSQLTPILPAPAPDSRPPMSGAPAPFLRAAPSVPLYAQNPLSLLLAKLNGSFGSPADRFSVPPIFHGRKQRSGKWITEEEEYAEVLIQLFEKGFLYDCENGSTLRSYLSRKLHCAPMRISKKYAGKGIGKMLFICRIRLNMSILAPCPEEMKSLERRANEKELLFYRAVFPEKLLPDPRDLLAACSGVEMMDSSRHAPAILPAPLSVNVGAAPMPAAAMASAAPSCGGPQVLPGTTAPGVFTAALQQSFFKALQQVAVTVDPTSLQPVVSLQNPPASEQVAHAQVVSSGVSAQPSTVTMNVPERQSYQVHAKPILSLDGDHQGLAMSPIWMQTSSPHPTVPTSKQVNVNTLSPVPDFLVGFDKVKLAMKPEKAHHAHGAVGDDLQQYSPPFTSRSFDDFHRFLGEDLAPLGSPVIQPSQPLHSYDPETIFSLASEAHAAHAPTYLWPGGRTSQIHQAAPVPGHGDSQHGEASHENQTMLHPYMLEMESIYDVSRAVAVSENNDSGRSSVDRSSSEQDNANSVSSHGTLDDSDDPEWEDRRLQKRRKTEKDQPERTNPPNAQAKSNIYSIG